MEFTEFANIPPVYEGGPKSVQLLPKEVTTSSDLGKFTASVLALVTRQTGVPITDKTKLFNFSTVKEAYGVPLIATTKEADWVISGYKDITYAGTSYRLANAPLTHIEIGHVSGWKDGGPVFDELLTAELVEGQDGRNQGHIEYFKADDRSGYTNSRTSLYVGNSQHYGPQRNEVVSAGGRPPGVKRARFSFFAEKLLDAALEKSNIGFRSGKISERIADRISRSKTLSNIATRDHERVAPQAIGSFIDRLPAKGEFEIVPIGTSTRSEVIHRGIDRLLHKSDVQASANTPK